MLRSTRALARPSAAVARRLMSGGQVRGEGSVAQSQGFNKKEKAHEDQYVHQQEVEKLRKLRETIEAAKKELASAESALEQKENETKK